MRFCALWPTRRQTALVSYASRNPRRHDKLWVSARVRNEVKNREGMRRVFTEELLFILRQKKAVNGGSWRCGSGRSRRRKGLP